MGKKFSFQELFIYENVHICDHLCINRPFTANIKIQFFTSSSYWTLANNGDAFLVFIRLIVLKLYDSKCSTVQLYISRTLRFQIHIRTPFPNSPRTNHFIFNECIQSSWTEFVRRCIAERRCRLWHKYKIGELRPVCYFGPYWKLTFCGERSVYA